MTGVVIDPGDVSALRSLPEGSVLLDASTRVYQLHVDRSGRHWRSTTSIAWQSDAGLARRGPLRLLWHATASPAAGDVSREKSGAIEAPVALDPRLVELGRRVVLRRRVGAPYDVPVQVEGVFVQWMAGEPGGSALDRNARLVLDHEGNRGVYLVRNYSVHSAPTLSIR